MAERDLDREIGAVSRTLETRAGPTSGAELARLAGARQWGPGRFKRALRGAVDEGRVRRVGRDAYEPLGRR
jgi:hypothetical protein